MFEVALHSMIYGMINDLLPVFSDKEKGYLVSFQVSVTGAYDEELEDRPEER